MKRVWIAAISLLLLAATSHADAKTFRYAYRIDPASLDPHALAETFTLSWLGQIYEPLVGRGKNLELVPGARDEVGAAKSHHMALPSAAERQISWRRSLHG